MTKRAKQFFGQLIAGLIMAAVLLPAGQAGRLIMCLPRFYRGLTGNLPTKE